jgi:hypothetical protein
VRRFAPPAISRSCGHGAANYAVRHARNIEVRKLLTNDLPMNSPAATEEHVLWGRCEHCGATVPRATMSIRNGRTQALASRVQCCGPHDRAASSGDVDVCLDVGLELDLDMDMDMHMDMHMD